MKAISKHMSIQYRKNGNEYIDYVIQDAEDYIKSVSPIQFIKLDLPDTTTEYQSNKCYSLLIWGKRNKMVFGRFLDIVKENKAKGITMENNPKEFYMSMI